MQESKYKAKSVQFQTFKAQKMNVIKILTVLILNLSIIACYTENYNRDLYYNIYGFQRGREDSGFHPFLPNVSVVSPTKILIERTNLLICYNTKSKTFVFSAAIIEIELLETEDRRICNQTSKLQSYRVTVKALTKDIVFLTCARKFIDSAKKFEIGYYNMFLTRNLSAKFDAKKFNKPINFLVNGSRINECYCRNNQSEEKILTISNDSILGRFLTALFIVSIIILCMLLFNINLRE
jgi:hypothetical protein